MTWSLFGTRTYATIVMIPHTVSQEYANKWLMDFYATIVFCSFMCYRDIISYLHQRTNMSNPCPNICWIAILSFLSALYNQFMNKYNCIHMSFVHLLNSVFLLKHANQAASLICFTNWGNLTLVSEERSLMWILRMIVIGSWHNKHTKCVVPQYEGFGARGRYLEHG